VAAIQADPEEKPPRANEDFPMKKPKPKPKPKPYGGKNC